AHSATIQGAHDDPGLVVVHTRYRGHTPQITGARHVANLLPTERAMLTLEPDPVKTKLPQEIDHVGIGMARHQRDRLPFPQFSLDPILTHTASPRGSQPLARGRQ